MDHWRPETENAADWAAYIESLLTAGNNEPFYTSAELSVHEGAFFTDVDMLNTLNARERTTAVPEDFFEDKANWRKFWRRHVSEADENLLKEFILKRQGF